jgi:hypothetical protein
VEPDYSRIPAESLRTLRAWIATGRARNNDDNATEAFVQAVVMNDLEAAVARADQAHVAAFPEIMHWLRQHAPRGGYGSPAALGA